jgi:hypothetical protein
VLKSVRDSVVALLVVVVAAVPAFVTSVSAAPDTPGADRSGTGFPETGTMFLTGLALLALAFVARQFVRRNGSRSAN